MTTLIYIYTFVLTIALVYHYYIYRPAYRYANGEPLEHSSTWFTLAIGWVIIVIVIGFRAFIYDMYRIPSESMEPSYHKGVLVVASKASYGFKKPFTNEPINNFQDPEKGQPVLVLNPRNTETTFFKRIIGSHGDRIEYKNKRLIINGKPLPITQISQHLFEECQGDICYRVQFDPKKEAIDGSWTLDSSQYFVMGDNRDNSSDAREWGPLLPRHLIGKVTTEATVD